MLRNLVLLVLLANLLLWAALSGWFDPPNAGREPERLNLQINPDAIRLLPRGQPGTAAQAFAPQAAAEGALAAASSPAPAARTALLCVQSAGNDNAQGADLQTLAQSLAPAARVSLSAQPAPSRWMVYMGKYSGNDALNKKLDELRGLKLPGNFGRVTNVAALQPGISLGVYAERERAAARLAELEKRGVKNAKLVERPSGTTLALLRVEQLDPKLRTALSDALLKAGAQALDDCPPGN